jgi:hypothetical protein
LISTFAAVLATYLASAPSFDCARASGPAEKAICHSDRLAQLDARLDAAFRTALQQEPSNRAAVTEAQRSWVRGRDRTCKNDEPCLVGWYRERISELSDPAHGAADPQCRAFIRNYHTMLAARSVKHSALPPFEELSQGRSPGIALSKPVAKLEDGSAASFSRWGRTLSPPLAFDDSPFRENLPQNSFIYIHQVPGERWYAATYVAGTEYCVEGAYFKDVRGRAVPMQTPEIWVDPDGTASCGEAHVFGTVDDHAVALTFRSDLDLLEFTVDLSRWVGGTFSSPCHMKFGFSLEPMTRCDGKQCAGLRESALKAVAAAQDDSELTHAFRRFPIESEMVIHGVRYAIAADLSWDDRSAWAVTFFRLPQRTNVATFYLYRRSLQQATAW